MTATAFKEHVEGRFLQHLQQKKRSGAHASNRASQLGDECLRKLVLWRTNGHEAAPISDVLAAIFQEGDMIEREVKRILSDLGIDMIGAQRSFPPNDYQISGHIDGEVIFDGEILVVEVKSINGYDFDVINTSEDMRTNRKPLLRRYYDQMQLYLFLADRDRGALIFYSKQTGELKVIPVEIDLDRIQELTEKAEQINGYVESGLLPDYLDDPIACKRCPFFGRVCSPPLDYGSGVQIISDPAMLEDLERREECAEDHREFMRLDRRIKEWIRLALGEGNEADLIAGDFVIQVAMRERAGKQTQVISIEKVSVDPS